MNPTPITELGVAEAYEILLRLGVADLPPLEAIESEDWGRDSLLARFETLSPATLLSLNLVRDDEWDPDSSVPGTDDAG